MFKEEMKMQEDYSKILAEKEAQEDALLQLEGVHAVGIGYKVKDGKTTDELSIVIFTSLKKQEGLLAQDQLIPSTYNGVATDVIEQPAFEPIPVVPSNDGVLNSLTNDGKKYRPIPGGAMMVIRAGESAFNIGTVGMIARSVKPGDAIEDVYLLSNAHCFPVPDGELYQNSTQKGDLVAKATRNVSSEAVDGGIAKLINPLNADLAQIIDIGRPRGTYAVTANDLGKKVVKRGCTTETTRGKIIAIEVSANARKHQITIESATRMAGPGDSGSVVLLEEDPHKNHVIGLLWGGNDTGAIMSPITAVEKELQIKVCARPFGVEYSAHVDSGGWLPYVQEGQVAGTTGQGRRLEAVKINLANCDVAGAKIKYRMHVKDKGWLPYVYNNQAAGTTGEKRRAEAIEIELEGLPGYSVFYRAHMRDKGWSAWVRDGAVAGTTGEKRRIEAVQVFITEKQN